MAPSALLSLLALAGCVAGHGHVTHVVVDGVAYESYNPQTAPWLPNPPAVAGWAADQANNGFIDATQYRSPDIICHKDAVPGRAHIRVAAGQDVTLQWTQWPAGHKGSVLDFLAACGGGNCEDVDKTALEFFRIDGLGLVEQSPAAGQTGRWATDLFTEAGNAWTVRIPENIRPGNYVLRHEIIALHSANEKGGAQNYPQCINLEVTGSGSDVPAGVRGTDLFDPEDRRGIFVNIYQTNLDYEVPGGAVVGGVTAVEQRAPVITATSSATVPGAAPTPRQVDYDVVPPPASPDGAASTTAAPEPLHASRKRRSFRA